MKDRRLQEQAPPVPQAARQGAETRDWSWVEATIWTERMVSALVMGVKGGKWFSLVDKLHARTTLARAWEKVQANAGAAGVDGLSVERFSSHAEDYLRELETQLRTQTYRPQPVRRVDIPKGDGKTRPLGIPAVKDRIVQTGMKLVLEPIFEAQFRPSSYGFRPGRGCKDALREVDGLLRQGYTHVVDADFESFFDSIPHQRLMERVEATISDGRILDLIRQWLTQDIIKELERWTPVAGTPQGAVISPLLANVFLHPLDVALEAAGHKLVRYADDFVVLCKSREEAQSALATIRHWSADNGLRLHPDKTHIGDCRNEGEGFEFLGYRFEAGQRWVRKKSLNKLKDKIRDLTKRTCGQSLASVIGELNPVLKGWFGYFKQAHRFTFERIDRMVRRRLRAVLRKQEKRPGIGRGLRDHRQWPNTYFANQGLFTLEAAWHLARHSRSGNN